MNFAEAMNAVVEGNTVRRRGFNTKYFSESGHIVSNPSSVPFSFYDVTATDWEIVGKPMTFDDAIKAAIRGKRVKRKTWIYSMVGNCDDFRVFSEYGNYQYILRPIDFEATDWEIVE